MFLVCLFRSSAVYLSCFLSRTMSASIQRPHIEDINPLHLSQNLQPLQTGGLFEIGRDGAWRRTGSYEVTICVDLVERLDEG